MCRKDIIEWLLAAGLACEATGSKWCAEICMASAYIVETGKVGLMNEEAAFQRRSARRGFRDNAGSGAITWPIYVARVRAFCAYMLCMAAEAT